MRAQYTLSADEDILAVLPHVHFLGKDLRVFAKEAKWSEDGDLATGVVEANPERKIEAIGHRKVFLKRIGERWFMKNEQQ